MKISLCWTITTLRRKRTTYKDFISAACSSCQLRRPEKVRSQKRTWKRWFSSTKRARTRVTSPWPPKISTASVTHSWHTCSCSTSKWLVKMMIRTPKARPLWKARSRACHRILYGTHTDSSASKWWRKQVRWSTRKLSRTSSMASWTSSRATLWRWICQSNRSTLTLIERFTTRYSLKQNNRAAKRRVMLWTSTKVRGKAPFWSPSSDLKYLTKLINPRSRSLWWVMIKTSTRLWLSM